MFDITSILTSLFGLFSVLWPHVKSKTASVALVLLVCIWASHQPLKYVPPADAFLLKNCSVHLIKSVTDLVIPMKHLKTRFFFNGLQFSKQIIILAELKSDETKSEKSTWAHVYSRCSAACSFCRICLWFQGRRSEMKTETVSQHVEQRVAARLQRWSGYQSKLGVAQRKCASTRPDIVTVLKWSWLYFTVAAANWRYSGLIPFCLLALWAHMMKSSSKSTFTITGQVYLIQGEQSHKGPFH